MRLLLAAGLISAIALGGCQSDESIMAQARKEIGDSCRKTPPPGVNADRYCSCVVDRSVGSKSVADLRKMSEQDGQALGMQAASACLAELAPAPATPAPAGPAAQVPAETSEAVGEATEEAVDEAQ